MRWKSPHVCLLALLGLLGAIFVVLQFAGYKPVSQETPREEGPPTKAQIEKDLQLRVELDPRSMTIQVGGYPRVKARLVNTSRTRTHWVVKPSTGSEIPSREPHFHWTATFERDGKQTSAPKRYIGYCGWDLILASEWERDWVELPPGGELQLEDDPLLEFEQAGRVRLQAHYDFRWDRCKHNPSLKEMSAFIKVPAFSLNSEPAEFDVIRPLDVRLKVKGTLKARQKTRLSDLFSITAMNQSNGPISCAQPTIYSNEGGRVLLQLRAKLAREYDAHPHMSEQRESHAKENVAVKPGEEVSLLGKGDFANGMDGFWVYPKKETVWLRAGYERRSREYAPTVWSEWVEVQVIE